MGYIMRILRSIFSSSSIRVVPYDDFRVSTWAHLTKETERHQDLFEVISRKEHGVVKGLVLDDDEKLYVFREKI